MKSLVVNQFTLSPVSFISQIDRSDFVNRQEKLSLVIEKGYDLGPRFVPYQIKDSMLASDGLTANQIGEK